MKPRKRELFAIMVFVLAGCLLLPRGVFASEEAGDKWGVWLTIGRFFNLAVVVGLLGWVLRKPLANFFISRSQSIKEQLAEARKARLEAEAKLSEMQSRMSRLDEELKEMQAEAEKIARAEQERLAAAARQDGAKIIERARQEIGGMTRTAQLELREHVAGLAVKLAEEKIRHEISDEDRKRLFADFVGGLGGKA